MTESGDGLWVRLLDVPRALEARTYERSGGLVFEVVDDEAGPGQSRFLLNASPDGTTCRPTDRSADLTLHASAVGAAYLGGFSFGELARAGTVRELKDGAAARADAVFAYPAPKPWCPEIF